ncbi:uncharacterized protein EURHEDRAFT_409993 [Aspergillus ruber CBS 135680]|uniref:Uncharacterized protein n=1 Tax=Aspergillus ruber (strain CBS 135680) TaxID=1388766 RepID=A0A017SLC7_ASPRC|nr:uncharacterized protein EURHEDRAFT_409993 [Aspergillus ruber CBS 135680]EYE97757.1 hypothetical protein EURHEDRAFT_409993 [Aspergillus ruber CBS 135680]
MECDEGEPNGKSKNQVSAMAKRKEVNEASLPYNSSNLIPLSNQQTFKAHALRIHTDRPPSSCHNS